MSAHASINRRQRPREKVQATARASFGTRRNAEEVPLYEILDISELGMAIQCPLPMEINQEMELCLHVSESIKQLSVTARVVWSNSSGRLGLGFSAVADSELHRVQEWLSLNTTSGSASSGLAVSSTPEHSPVSLNHTDKLSGVAALPKEAESVGENLEAVV
ncbi:MAG TPA: PilZ domain-containing protein, partial [Candidatus Acidoferrum sp.]|nr:PilZ domain-containing protein [Candidatus Acidoferrum sp.]